MGTPLGFRQEVVHWHPKIPGQRKRPDIQFECITSLGEPGGEEFGLTITGFAEGDASRLAAVAAAEERGEWMVATGLRFDQLSPTPLNMDRMAFEGPQFLADHFGHGVIPAHLRTTSLGAVSLPGVVYAPERFSRVSSMAPFPLVNEALGSLPLFGSSDFMRRADVALRLGVITPAQLVHRWLNGGVAGMAGNARRELRAYGDGRNDRLNYGFHPEQGRRVAAAAVQLISTHDWFGVFGRSDALVRRGPARAALIKAAVEAGVDPAIIDARIITASGPHAPVSSPEGLGQFRVLLKGLPQTEAAAEPASSGFIPGFVRQLGGAVARKLAA